MNKAIVSQRSLCASPVCSRQPLTRATLPGISFDNAKTMALSTAVGTAVAVSLMLPLSAHAQDPAAVFGVSCAGCHQAGGNIMKPQATLQVADLEKNGLTSVDELYKIIYSGKATMPGFGIDCAPKLQCTFAQRLADEDVQNMAQYVLDQAKAGWPKP